MLGGAAVPQATRPGSQPALSAGLVMAVRVLSRDGRGIVRKKLVLLTLTVLAFAAMARAQPGTYTRHLDRDLLNGNGWKQWDARAKIGYMHGMFDGGLAFMLINIDLLPDAQKPWVKFVADPKATYQDTITAIDSFYGDAENMKIPIIFAYIYNVMRSRGFAPGAVDEYVGRWRKEFNK